MANELAQPEHHSQPYPAHPSLNIKEEFLSIATSTAWQNSGLPWCYRVFPEAPNPGLHVNDIGILGVPLDTLEGEHVEKIINQGHEAPSEALTTVSSTSWSLNANQFRFENPNFGAFLAQVSQWAFTALGYEAAVREVNPPKVLLSWVGVGAAADLSHIAQETNSSNKLVTVLMIMPSLFGGGAVQLHHEDYAQTFQLDTIIPGDMAALAWHATTKFTSEPIASGSYLTLAFNLVSSEPVTPAPTLGPQCAELARLGQLLQTWHKARRATTPSKLVYLFKHKYSYGDVRKGVLRGSDAHLAEALETCAGPQGFKLGLAVLTCQLGGSRHHTQITGSDSDEDDKASVEPKDAVSNAASTRGVSYVDEDEDRKPFPLPTQRDLTSKPNDLPDDRYSYDYESDNGKPPTPDPDSESLSSSRFSSPGYCPIHSYQKDSKPLRRIGPLVDFSGNLVCNKMDYDRGTDVIPLTLHETLIASPNTYLRWDVGSWDRHLLLVIWPSWADFDVDQGRKAFPEACARLRASASLRPSREEEELVDLVVARATPESSSEVVDSVCRTARTWKDLNIWLSAVKACDADRSIATLDRENICGAVDVFGFEAVRHIAERAIQRDPSDVTALRFLREFSDDTRDKHGPGQSPNVVQWASEQRSSRLRGVKAQIDAFLRHPDDTTPQAISSIVHAAALGIEPSLIFTCLIPKIDALSVRSDILRAMIDELRGQAATLDPEGQALREVVPQLLLKFSNSVDLENASSPERVATTLDAMKYCLSAGSPAACSALLARVVHPDWAVSDSVEYIKNTLAPLLVRLIPFLVRKKQLLLSSTFAPAIRAILLQWGETVMGPRPAETTAALEKLSQLEKWSCTCDACVSVRDFLRDEPEGERTWERMGGTKRKHVEKFLKAHAAGIATFKAIMTRPQGIQVMKDASVSKPLCWTAYQKQGTRLLRTVNSNPGTLSTILGPDGPVIAALFSGQDISDDVSEVTTESVQERFATLMVSGSTDRELSPISVDDSDAPPSPGPSDAPPTTASVGRSTSSPVSYASIPSRSPSPTRTGSPLESERPSKRRRAAYDPQDVIDLT
ncbi:hypothetical protein VTO73DRAFT_11077 [Trametes versicolor]